MTPTSIDSFLFYKSRDSSCGASATPPDGLSALQVDNSLICGSEKFLQTEEMWLKRFQCKNATNIVDDGDFVAFNGAAINLIKESITYRCWKNVV